MARVIAHTGEVINEPTHTWQGPQFGAVSGGARSFQQRGDNLLTLSSGDFGFATSLAFAAQGSLATRLPRLLPTVRHLPPITAPLATLQDRCIATPRLLAHTAACHLELHLPYYRIAQQYARLGPPIERQTLGGWMGMAHEASGQITRQIKREVFADGYVQGMNRA
jgi:hypothetical protein